VIPAFELHQSQGTRRYTKNTKALTPTSSLAAGFNGAGAPSFV
jgi:hypothetical protein